MWAQSTKNLFCFGGDLIPVIGFSHCEAFCEWISYSFKEQYDI